MNPRLQRAMRWLELKKSLEQGAGVRLQTAHAACRQAAATLTHLQSHLVAAAEQRNQSATGAEWRMWQDQWTALAAAVAAAQGELQRLRTVAGQAEQQWLAARQDVRRWERWTEQLQQSEQVVCQRRLQREADERAAQSSAWGGD
ncbi:MAG: flagellar FliJ family protein [Alicyclobacillus sp.]|nr:flagellar FliJ family protein [Alicyclobacillus sp.]